MEKHVTVTNYGPSSPNQYHSHQYTDCTDFSDEITTAQIWQHIEPSTSIVAACLPTYGNLFAGKPPFFASLRSFFSLRSRSSSGNGRSSGASPSNEKILVPSASNKSGKSSSGWRILDKNSNNHFVEITSQNKSGEHGASVHDLEAGLDTNPYRIDVTKEFGSDAREK